MIELENNRIQIEVMSKIEDVKQTHKASQDLQEKTSFLAKFFKPDESVNKKLKILFCEDSKLLSLIVRKMLELKGFEVTVSETPVHFLSKESLKSFDLVITDNNMPYMTGTQFTEYVEKELRIDLPMYIYSGDPYLKEELDTTKVRRGIFEKGIGFEKVLQSILDDFKIYKKELNTLMS